MREAVDKTRRCGLAGGELGDFWILALISDQDVERRAWFAFPKRSAWLAPSVLRARARNPPPPPSAVEAIPLRRDGAPFASTCGAGGGGLLT